MPFGAADSPHRISLRTVRHGGRLNIRICSAVNGEIQSAKTVNTSALVNRALCCCVPDLLDRQYAISACANSVEISRRYCEFERHSEAPELLAEFGGSQTAIRSRRPQADDLGG